VRMTRTIMLSRRNNKWSCPHMGMYLTCPRNSCYTDETEAGRRKVGASGGRSWPCPWEFPCVRWKATGRIYVVK
jgi:hypothetical protein